MVRDARLALVSKKRRQIVDARDKLVELARKTDARKKIDLLKSRKAGKVLKNKNGVIGKGIIVTKDNKGQVILTTTNNNNTNNKRQMKTTFKRTTKVHSTPSFQKNKIPLKIGKMSERKELTRTIPGKMSQAAKLDHELMNTHVDPVILKRTVRQNVVRRSSIDEEEEEESRYYRHSPPRYASEPLYHDHRSSLRRSRSPVTTIRRPTLSRRESSSPLNERRRGVSSGLYSSSPHQEISRNFRHSFDNQRREENTKRGIGSIAPLKSQENDYRFISRILETNYSGTQSLSSESTTSSGYKVIVNNLQVSVTQQDIVELFGDIGPLRRAKIAVPGKAEVVFVTREDAQKAVEIYHNRQLDGKAMKCVLMNYGSSYK